MWQADNNCILFSRTTIHPSYTLLYFQTETQNESSAGKMYYFIFISYFLLLYHGAMSSNTQVATNRGLGLKGESNGLMDPVHFVCLSCWMLKALEQAEWITLNFVMTVSIL